MKTASYSPGVARKNLRRGTIADFRSLGTSKPTHEGYLLVRRQGEEEGEWERMWAVLMEYHLLLFGKPFFLSPLLSASFKKNNPLWQTTISPKRRPLA